MMRASRTGALKPVKGRLEKLDERRSPSPTDIYNELLVEAAAATSNQAPERPLKRRKVWKPGPSTLAASSPASSHAASETTVEKQAEIQTVFTETEQSEEDDFEWEDVTLQQENLASSDEVEVGPIPEGITLKFEEDKPGKAKSKRKAPGVHLDKSTRIQVHKAHIISLLMHAFIRNAWCNDHEVQGTMKRLVPSKVRSSLKPDSGISQFNKDKHFKEGLNDLKDIWRINFKHIKQGIRPPSWLSYVKPARFRLPRDTERLVDIQDFRNAAKSLEGSQDSGVQLLCAALRALGVETRLVCSLQPLSFIASSKDFCHDDDVNHSKDGTENTVVSDNENSTGIPVTSPNSLPHPRKRRIGQPSFGVDKSGPPPEAIRKRTYKTRFPVYWVEAFNTALQKWTPIEPFSTNTVGKPSKLEPPANQSSGGVRMVYVIAFEEDGVAKDVTKRYASAYNAKTRRERIESTEDGERWFKKAMRIFRRRGEAFTDRDQIETAELAKKEAQEGMPRAIQDFKDHPLYALERHLKRNEVIHPKREVGKVGATGKAAKLEPVYRRVDVKVARSADKWYRLGREIMAGEQPLKHLPPTKISRGLYTNDDIDADAIDDSNAGTPLYASFQTQVYTPPPCVRGRVPKNAFGNIDLYVPSMVPPGGTHIRHLEASRAAKLMDIDYADAVTGFEFKGRRGTAVTQGIVVAEEYAAAVEAVLESMEYAREQSEEDARSLLALRTWKKFLVGLRVLQRVNEYEIEGEQGPLVRAEDDTGTQDEYTDEPISQGGGFFPDAEQSVAVPTARQSRRRLVDESEAEEDIGDESDWQHDSGAKDQGRFAHDDVDFQRHGTDPEEGGGFLVEDGEGAGFLPAESKFRDARNESPAEHKSDALSDDFGASASLDGGGFIPNDEESTNSQSESRLEETYSETEPVDQDDVISGTNRVPYDRPDPSHADDLEIQLALAKSMEKQPGENQSSESSTKQFKHRHATHESLAQWEAPALDGLTEHERQTGSIPSAADTKASLESPTAFEDLDTSGQVEELSNDDDRGSLLSHDPEDEEAEPDWLTEI
ncbi:Rad4-domain-containing protein [Viridothelium virens]|uniref:Rad4-domain-containing protein n=1 Tax=Viridothelium virens TaxID=1048519 RepID=A0A6A6HPF4_VIRVR|nr:Rad4-domain-containing protein [Viridothelium virens]